MSKRIISIILAAVLLLSASVSCFAFSWKSVDGNGKSITDCDDSVVSVRDYVYSYLSDNTGLSHAAICGILGNIWAECGFQHSLTGAYNGLCQWERSTRWADCISRFGSDLESQCKFIVYELTQGSYKSTYNKLLKVENSEQGVIDAERIFRVYYEGCGNQAAQRRQDAALMYFRNLKSAETKTIEIAEPDTIDALMMQMFTMMIAAMKTLNITM